MINPAEDPLAALRDIHASATPEFWPPAPGWWLLAILVAIAIIFFVLEIRRHLQQKKQLREVLSLIDQAADSYSGQPVKLATTISKVLRRVAIRQYAVKDVASLSGSEWLGFLDRTGGNGGFSTGPGEVIATAPYGQAENIDEQGLLKLARQWVRENYR